MKIRTLRAFLAGMAMLSSGLAFPDGPPTVPETVAVSTSGGFDLAGDRAYKVYVEFLASPRLTTAMREALSGRGLVLVDTRDLADIVYEFDGQFTALRPATHRSAEVRVGEYAENPASLRTKSARGPSVMLSFNPLAMLIGTIAANVGNGAGAQDSVNAAFGDPDGKCLSRCERWAYKQSNVVKLSRIKDGVLTGVVASQAETTADALQPAALITASLSGVAKKIGVDLPSSFFSPPGVPVAGQE